MFRKVITATLLGFACHTVVAQTSLLFATGFEPPLYSLGTLTGQDGWNEDHIYVPNSADVITGTARSGAQSVKVSPVNDPGGTNPSWWYRPVSYDTGGTGFITVIWDMNVQPGSLQGNYGIDLYTPDVSRICALRVDFNDVVQLVGYPGGTLTVIDTSANYTRGTWARFKLELDYSARTFRAFMNGQEIASSEFRSAGAIGNVFGDADIWITNVGGDSDDHAYYDNLRIIYSTSPLPEGDVDFNGCVDDADLLAVLFAFGSEDADADVNSDGVVDDADLLIVLFNFGSGC